MFENRQASAGEIAFGAVSGAAFAGGVVAVQSAFARVPAVSGVSSGSRVAAPFAAAVAAVAAGVERGSVNFFPRAGAAHTVADGARPLSQAEATTLIDALRPDKLSHVFDPKHNLGPLVESYGSEAGAMEQIARSIGGAGLPRSGLFEVMRQVGGQSVVVRGAVVDGVVRIGTAFTP